MYPAYSLDHLTNTYICKCIMDSLHFMLQTPMIVSHANNRGKEVVRTIRHNVDILQCITYRVLAPFFLYIQFFPKQRKTHILLYLW